MYFVLRPWIICPVIKRCDLTDFNKNPCLIYIEACCQFYKKDGQKDTGSL